MADRSAFDSRDLASWFTTDGEEKTTKIVHTPERQGYGREIQWNGLLWIAKLGVFRSVIFARCSGVFR